MKLTRAEQLRNLSILFAVIIFVFAYTYNNSMADSTDRRPAEKKSQRKWYQTKTARMRLVSDNIIEIRGRNDLGVPPVYKPKYARIDIKLIWHLSQKNDQKINIFFVASWRIKSSMDSMRLFKREVHKPRFGKAAVVEHGSGILKMLCNVYLYISGLSSQVKFFNNEKEAWKWLLEASIIR